MNKRQKMLNCKRSKMTKDKQNKKKHKFSMNFLNNDEFFTIKKEHLSNLDSAKLFFSQIPVKFKLDKNFSDFPVLKYDIDSWSSYTHNHHPKNIMIDEKDNNLSRWSVQYRSQKEYVFLKLSKTAVVFSIIFGKYKESDPTNLKEFKVYAGIDKDNMVEVLSAGLTNDNDYEEFPIKNFENGYYLPCK